MVRLAQHGQGGIHTHGCDSFTAVLRHRQNTLLHFIVGVTEGLLHPLTLFVGVLRNTLVRDMDALKLGQVVVQPFAVGLSGSIFFLDLLIVDDSSLYGIYQKHLAGTESFL